MSFNPDRQLLLNFSGAYSDQRFSAGTELDFSGLGGTCCYCDPDSASEIRDVLAQYGYAGVHWLDSGDYHYLSLFFLEMVERPFRLVLFDNHPDDQESAFGEGLLSCGNWVSHARRLPLWREDGDDLPVYLSIDKDVLSEKYARTDWNQGTMELGYLCDRVREIAAGAEILGIDVCGEISPSKGATPEDLQINRRTNEILRDLFLTLKD